MLRSSSKKPMIIDTRSYLVRVGDAISQLINTILFNGDPDESVSGRSYRSFKLKESDNKIWVVTYYIAEALFWLRDRGIHCKLAYYEDIERWGLRVKSRK